MKRVPTALEAFSRSHVAPGDTVRVQGSTTIVGARPQLVVAILPSGSRHPLCHAQLADYPHLWVGIDMLAVVARRPRAVEGVVLW